MTLEGAQPVEEETEQVNMVDYGALWKEAKEVVDARETDILDVPGNMDILACVFPRGSVARVPPEIDRTRYPTVEIWKIRRGVATHEHTMEKFWNKPWVAGPADALVLMMHPSEPRRRDTYNGMRGANMGTGTGMTHGVHTESAANSCEEAQATERDTPAPPELG